MLNRVLVECLNCAYWIDSEFLVAIHEDIGDGFDLDESFVVLEGYESLIEGVGCEVVPKQHFNEVVNEWLYSIYGEILHNPYCVQEDYDIDEVTRFFNYLNNYTLR